MKIRIFEFERIARALWPSLLTVGAMFSGYGQIYTPPVGVMTYTIPATGAAQTTTTYISVPLINQAFQSALVTAVSDNTLTVGSSSWTPGAFAVAGSPFFVKVASGQQAGRFLLVTANTANTLTVDTSDHSSQTTPLNGAGFAIQANDRIQLIAGDTLASFFGDGTANNPLQLVGAASPFAADTVSVYNSILGRVDAYYFNTTQSAWNASGSTVSQNSVVLYPDMAVGITRRPNRPQLTFTLTGDVPEVPPLTKTTGGNTSVIYACTRYPVDMALSSFNIANWTKSDSAFTADTIGIWNAALGRWDGYYQLANSQWRKAGDAVTNQSAVVIPAGAGIQILKRAAVSGQASFLAAAMPYTIN